VWTLASAGVTNEWEERSLGIRACRRRRDELPPVGGELVEGAGRLIRE
jgi:hypothetical protein